MVIWILGLSGSGKTTLAKLINKNLKKEKFLHIDGDLVRKIYEKKLGHTIRDRLINAKRISRLVKFLSDQNINIVVSVLSNFPKWLKWNRDNIKKYFEIYLNTNLKILKKRKPNLYSRKIKNVVGVDIKFNEPKNADMTINNCNSMNDLSRASKKIIKKIKFN
jgi:adenylylsulfate kinase-like enzyme